MISDRLYLITYYICRVGCIFGSFAIKLDPKNRVLLRCDDPKVKIMCNITTFLNNLRTSTSIFLTIKSLLDGDINQFVLKLLFTISGAILQVIQSIALNHVDDIILLVNLALGLLDDTQGLSKYPFKICN